MFDEDLTCRDHVHKCVYHVAINCIYDGCVVSLPVWLGHMSVALFGWFHSHAIATCYMCRCRQAGCLFWNIRYCPGYGLLQGMLFEKKCCNIGYTVLALLCILLNDALKVTYYWLDPLKWLYLVYKHWKWLKYSWVQHRYNECLLIFGLHQGLHLQMFGLAQG